mgnify:CR=1 FL=1
MDQDTRELLILVAAVLSGANAAVQLCERLIQPDRKSKKARKRPKPCKQKRRK